MPDNMMKVTILKDTALLDTLIASIADIADQGVQDTANSMKDYIVAHWSSDSPSAPGDFPAKVTGYLENSIRVLRRGAGGRFSTSADAIQWSLQVEAEYGAALEYGYPPRNLAPRPFLRPALMWAQYQIGGFIKTRFDWVVAKRGTGTKAVWMETGQIIPQGLEDEE